MTLKRILLALASLALGAVLVAFLIRVGKIDLRQTWHMVQSVSCMAFAKLALLNVLLIFISTEKWRGVDASLRSPSDSIPSRGTAFALTSAGMALGLVLPVQLGMAVARTMGTCFYGTPFKRGTAGTLLEQSFDVVIICFLAVASGVTWFFHGAAIMWTACAVAMTVVASLAVGPSMRLIRRLALYVASWLGLDNRIGIALKNLSELEDSGLLSSGLANQLMLLSTIRFAIVALMAAQTSEAIGAAIPIWQMAAMVPFVVVATVFAVTPGGIGVNELTSVTALRLFGTPLDTAARWALANRILATSACFLVAAAAAATVSIYRIASSCYTAAESREKARQA
jgi:uncharacterized membrane protein YbhN (UPF0104 family)